MKERWTVRWLRTRALVYHLIVAILAPGCLLAGWWQINRAESGNTLSYLYAVEWPIFAILAVVGWWQLIHEDPAAVESRQVERARRAAERGPFVPPPPEAGSGFYHPLGTGAREALDAGPIGIASLAATPRGGGRLVPGGHRHGEEVGTDEAPVVHALSSYNAYLARLSAAGGRKSWRNPRGLTTGVASVGPTADRAARRGGDGPPPRTRAVGTGAAQVVGVPAEGVGVPAVVVGVPVEVVGVPAVEATPPAAGRSRPADRPHP